MHINLGESFLNTFSPNFSRKMSAKSRFFSPLPGKYALNLIFFPNLFSLFFVCFFFSVSCKIAHKSRFFFERFFVCFVFLKNRDLVGIFWEKPEKRCYIFYCIFCFLMIYMHICDKKNNNSNKKRPKKKRTPSTKSHAVQGCLEMVIFLIA